VINNLRLPELKKVNIFWICTLEWDAEHAIKCLPDLGQEQIVVIRSTLKPGDVKRLQDKYQIQIAHVPEFLRQATAIEDSFNPDRVIIGADSNCLFAILDDVFKTFHVPIVHVSTETSAMIKLVSNAWLSTQISFWNQIYELTKKMYLNPEEVANAVTLDRRISGYGSNMVGKSFGGVCLPKDLDSIIKLFEKNSIRPDIFHAVKDVNIRIGGENGKSKEKNS